jgi:hypothetical protein
MKKLINVVDPAYKKAVISEITEKVNAKFVLFSEDVQELNNKLYFKISDPRYVRGYRYKIVSFCPDKTKAIQSQKEECDINNIMKKHRLRQVPIVQPQYTDANFGDFSNIPNPQEAFQIVEDARNAFNQLEPRVRKEFGHDPLRMLEFCADNANYNRAVELGLVDKKVDPAPSPVQNEAGSQPSAAPEGSSV